MAGEYEYVVDAKHPEHGTLHLDGHRIPASSEALGVKLLTSVLEENGYIEIEVKPAPPRDRAD
jgi:hypothetical protein